MLCIKCSIGTDIVPNRKECRTCYNAYMADYMLKRYHRRRSGWLLKLGNCCIDCGITESLEFDHDDRTTKSFDVAKALSGWSNRKLVAEMTKCVLRCTSCHAEKSAAEESVDHGGGLTGKKNCRCDKCRPLKNAWQQQWKQKNNASVV